MPRYGGVVLAPQGYGFKAPDYTKANPKIKSFKTLTEARAAAYKIAKGKVDIYELHIGAHALGLDWPNASHLGFVSVRPDGVKFWEAFDSREVGGAKRYHLSQNGTLGRRF